MDPPEVFVCASAMGYYGDRGGELMTEDSQPGPSFLSRTCVEWEEATQAARDAGIRVVNLRIGVVLSPKGGALKKMLTPFKLGGGGVVGNRPFTKSLGGVLRRPTIFPLPAFVVRTIF